MLVLLGLAGRLVLGVRRRPWRQAIAIGSQVKLLQRLTRVDRLLNAGINAAAAAAMCLGGHRATGCCASNSDELGCGAADAANEPSRLSESGEAYGRSHRAGRGYAYKT
jgi:hypothetical protein